MANTLQVSDYRTVRTPTASAAQTQSKSDTNFMAGKGDKFFDFLNRKKLAAETSDNSNAITKQLANLTGPVANAPAPIAAAPRPLDLKPIAAAAVAIFAAVFLLRRR